MSASDKVSMARYDYRGECGHVIERDFRETSFVFRCPDPECDTISLFKRIYSAPAMKRPMREHYNYSVGQPIGSDRQFDEALKRQSDKMSEYQGMEAKFERVDPTDTKTLKVTEQGLDATNRRRHDRGLKPYKV